MRDAKKPMTIGQVAKLASVGVETIRFYEREGLLIKPKRKESGYRKNDVAWNHGRGHDAHGLVLILIRVFECERSRNRVQFRAGL